MLGHRCCNAMTKSSTQMETNGSVNEHVNTKHESYFTQWSKIPCIQALHWPHTDSCAKRDLSNSLCCSSAMIHSEEISKHPLHRWGDLRSLISKHNISKNMKMQLTLDSSVPGVHYSQSSFLPPSKMSLNFTIRPVADFFYAMEFSLYTSTNCRWILDRVSFFAVNKRITTLI